MRHMKRILWRLTTRGAVIWRLFQRPVQPQQTADWSWVQTWNQMLCLLPRRFISLTVRTTSFFVCFARSACLSCFDPWFHSAIVFNFFDRDHTSSLTCKDAGTLSALDEHVARSGSTRIVQERLAISTGPLFRRQHGQSGLVSRTELGRRRRAMFCLLQRTRRMEKGRRSVGRASQAQSELFVCPHRQTGSRADNQRLSVRTERAFAESIGKSIARPWIQTNRNQTHHNILRLFSIQYNRNKWKRWCWRNRKNWLSTFAMKSNNKSMLAKYVYKVKFSFSCCI